MKASIAHIEKLVNKKVWVETWSIIVMSVSVMRVLTRMMVVSSILIMMMILVIILLSVVRTWVQVADAVVMIPMVSMVSSV